MSGPPSKTKAGAGGGIRAFVSALQNLVNPKEAQGQVVDVPGYYWQGGSEAQSEEPSLPMCGRAVSLHAALPELIHGPALPAAVTLPKPPAPMPTWPCAHQKLPMQIRGLRT